MHVLLLATDDALAYRVLRCAAAAGLRPYVLGASDVGRARRLAWSRHCAGFVAVPARAFDDGSAAERINALTRDLALDAVMPGDARTTRFLTRHGARIAARTYPVPAAATFDALTDKARFAVLCTELGVRHPPTRVYADASALRAAVTAGELRLPVVAKPVAGAGGAGVRHIRGPAAAERAAGLTYRPVLVQDFVAGDDVSISLLCDDGAIRASATYRYADDAYVVGCDERVDALARRVVEAVRYTGVVGFDVRLGPHGEAWLIECNPRFTYHVDVTMLAGVNFVALGLGAAPSRGRRGTAGTAGGDGRGELRAPAQAIRHAKLLKPWTLRAGDRRHARYLLDDDLRLPLAVAMRELVHAKLLRPTQAAARKLRTALTQRDGA